VKRLRRKGFFAVMSVTLIAEIGLQIREPALFWAVNATLALGLAVVFVWAALRIALALETIASSFSRAARERAEEEAPSMDSKREQGPPHSVGDEAEDPLVTDMRHMFPYARYDRSQPFD
jgi:hypothetical protein